MLLHKTTVYLLSNIVVLIQGDEPLITPKMIDESEGDIITWQWNFGDNSSDSTRFLQNPIHQYNRADTFSVSLTVSDGILKSTIVMDNFIQITETDTSSVNE